ncbi:MazG family protein [Actinomycetospora soli]|uniref:MazG family protein n=1 Tax=Actinomycetospora soli TaxID=2893887 RepID=UPI001E51C746|nr:MazG family protein [Actinomycetospora soli]MCD2191183.1 MazG family protein [Actinomycetospora soli]
MSGPVTVHVDPRLGAVLPAGAVRLVAAAPAVLLDPSLPEPVAARFAAELGARPRPDDGSVPEGAVVLVAGRDPQAPAGVELLEAVAVMDRLRSPGGCPWDAEQTHESLLRYLVEETYELYDALAAGDVAASREELGDVLLQVLFHSRVAAEGEGYDVDAVAAELVAKLVGRHPHVFADGETVATASDQDRRWEELKATEKQRDSVLDGVAQAQPAAALLAKYVSRVRRAGVPDDVLAALAATDSEVARAVVEAAGPGGDPEGELRAAAVAFATRVRDLEAAAGGSSREVEFWRRAAQQVGLVK